MNQKGIILKAAAVFAALLGIAALPVTGMQARSLDAINAQSGQRALYAGAPATSYMFGQATSADAPEGTWTRQAAEHPIEIVDFSRSADASHIWGVGPFGRVLLTTDSGQNSSPSNVGDISAVLHSVDFADEQTGWTVGEGGNGGLIYNTTDGGASWFQQVEPSGQRVFGVDVISPRS